MEFIKSTDDYIKMNNIERPNVNGQHENTNGKSSVSKFERYKHQDKDETDDSMDTGNIY